MRTRRSRSPAAMVTIPSASRGAEQAAGVARVEPEAAPQRANLAAVGPDLPQHARLGERAVAREIVIVERADALRHGPVEAADLLDHLGGHCLTLVRYRGRDQPGR